MLIVSILALVLTACASVRPNTKIMPPQSPQKPKVTMVHLKGLENPQYFKDGNKGFLDDLISDIFTDQVKESLKKVAIQRILETEYYALFRAGLSSKGFEALPVTVELDGSKILASEKPEAPFAPFDIRPFKGQLFGADYALVLIPRQYGITRSYYGFIPISSPKGYCHLQILLVNLNDNTVNGFFESNTERGCVGDWDTPPDYFNLRKTLEEALVDVIRRGHAFMTL